MVVWSGSGHFAMSQAQLNATIDSLNQVISATQDDSVRIEAMMSWDSLIYEFNPDLDLRINEEIEDICMLHLNSVTESRYLYYSAKLSAALNIMGFIFEDRGLIQKSIECYQKALVITKFTNDLGIADKLYRNIGELCRKTGQYQRSLENLRSGYEIAILTKDVAIEIHSANQIGITYRLLADSSMTAGNTALADKYYGESNNYLNNALEKAIETDDEARTSIYQDLADLNRSQKKYLIALELSKSALTSAIQRKDTVAIAYSHLQLAKTNYDLEEYPAAVSSGFAGYEISRLGKRGRPLRDNAELLYKTYRKLNKPEDALNYYKIFIGTRDSLRDEENLSEALRQKYKLAYEKQVAEDSVAHAHEELMKEVEISKQQAELHTGKIWRYTIYGFLAVVLVATVYLYRGFRQKKRDHRIISEQKEEVEKHRKKILASINYAERIQKAILPDENLIRQHLAGFESFYLPRDIVSGDFFWFAHRDGCSFLALADCTGHGVPGAFMSMIGSTLLKDIVVDSKISNPSEALELLDREIKQLLNQTDEGSSEDGMEIALVAIDHHKGEIIFSGASQHLFILRDQIEMIQGDSRGVGGWHHSAEKLTKFSEKQISLAGVRAIYLCSDGLEDQFGFRTGEKFGRDRMVKLMSDPTSDVVAIAASMMDWKGDAPQVDDVCLLGVKFS